ncbi:MAG: SEFIR domain-containing protein, partial [Solirubrobacterales bacterium]
MRPTAFVSYAQSSRPWQETVLDFTTALRNPGGVEAEIDLFHDVDHQRWATFGANLIEASDFTLIAVDAAYKRRWLGREEKGVGAGVAREAAAIRAIYERDQEEFLKRIKLILLPGIGEEDVPGDLLGDCERFAVGSFDLMGLEGLLRSLYGRPAFPKPDLSPIAPPPPPTESGGGGAPGRGAPPTTTPPP